MIFLVKMKPNWCIFIFLTVTYTFEFIVSEVINNHSFVSNMAKPIEVTVKNTKRNYENRNAENEYTYDPFENENIFAEFNKIKNWEAEVEFDIKRNNYYNHLHYNSHDETTLEKGRNMENINTFSGELQRVLEANNEPVRSEATIGGFIQQDLDHFNRTDKRKWKQYFFYNTHNYDGNGVNFLMLGGEGPIFESQVLDNVSMLMIWAREFRANAFALEHRFYGESQPTGNLSTENLRYLNSEQALADAAVFIRSIDRKFRHEKPIWIVFGGSYPGNLAAWLRQKYPYLVVGAVASSAPVEAISEFADFYKIVSDSIGNYGGRECQKNISTFISKAHALASSKEGRIRLGICNNNVFNEKDLHYYLDSQISRIGWHVQSDDTTHARILAACRMFAPLSALVNSIPTTLYAKTTRTFFNCVEYSYHKYVASLQDISPTWYRAWFWQVCTQFGYFQTTTQAKGIFQGEALPHSYYLDMCRDVFGNHLNGHDIEFFVSRTNHVYGGSKYYNGTNVVFINGSEDPWHPLSVYAQPVKRNFRSIFVKGTSHCRDMYAPHSQDPPELTSAREIVRTHIAAWIRLRNLNKHF